MGVVVATVVVGVTALGLADLGSVALARARAQTAADAAALAAAVEIALGADATGGAGPPRAQPEVQAERFARANGGSLRACRCGWRSATVVAEVSVPARLRMIARSIGVTARAGADVRLWRPG